MLLMTLGCFINNVNILIMHRFIKAVPAIKAWAADNALKVAKYDNDLYHQMHQKIALFFSMQVPRKSWLGYIRMIF